MKRLFLLLLCTLFAFVGCETPADGTTQETPEQPIFVIDVDEKYVVPADGATVEVVVATNIEYSVSIPEEAKSWVSHTDTRSVRQETVVLTIAKNNETKSRTATITMLDAKGDVLDDFAIVQNAAVVENPEDKPETPGDEPETPGDEPGDNLCGDPTEITLTADKTTAEVGDVITFTVTDGTGKNVTASSTIRNMFDYSEVKNAKYKTTNDGTLEFFATRNGNTSNILTITVGAGGGNSDVTEGSAFLYKALVIDHTASGCSYCPRAVDNLHNLASKTSWGPYYNEVTSHAGRLAANDPAASEAATTLMYFQNVSNYPTIAVNFYNKLGSYSYSSIANALQNVVKKDGADVGISLSVEKGTSKVICSAQIKAAVSNEYKVNAWLLENNIYSPEQNGATKDYHYYYNHALRKTSETFNAGDISGKSIGMLYIGETYNYNCEISVDSSWVINNLEVLIVVAARNGSNQWEVVNSAVCGVGEATPFAYVD